MGSRWCFVLSVVFLLPSPCFPKSVLDQLWNENHSIDASISENYCCWVCLLFHPFVQILLPTTVHFTAASLRSVRTIHGHDREFSSARRTQRWWKNRWNGWWNENFTHNREALSPVHSWTVSMVLCSYSYYFKSLADNSDSLDSHFNVAFSTTRTLYFHPQYVDASSMWATYRSVFIHSALSHEFLC